MIRLERMISLNKKNQDHNITNNYHYHQTIPENNNNDRKNTLVA